MIEAARKMRQLGLIRSEVKPAWRALTKLQEED